MKNRLLPLVFVLGCYSAYSQVGIGTNNPHGAAQLEVLSGSKGILIPRVTLTDINDNTTVKRLDAGANSLLVYNLTGALPEGYYYWTAIDGKWNRIVTVADLTAATDAIGGADGIAGAAGLPGTPGSITTLDAIVKDANGNIYAYIGNETTVAGRDAEWEAKSPNWVKITGLNGADGIAGAAGLPGTPGSITTLDAIVKDTEGNIYAYIGTATTVAGRDAEWEAKSPNWVKITGLNGADGIAGAAGLPGTPGSITTLDAIVKDTDGNIYAYVGTATTVAGRDAEWEAKSPNWVKITGQNGSDGIAGAVGLPGTPGSITTLDAIVKDADGNIYIYAGSDNTIAGRDIEWAAKSPNWVKINGLNGADGIAGAAGLPGTAGSITTLDAIVKDTDGNIYAYIGTATTVAGRDAEWEAKSPNWVKITGLNGADGIAGAAGLPGTPGSITTLDAIVKDTDGNIYAYIGTATTVAGRDAEWEAKSPNWVKITGQNGSDGIAGAAGLPGTPGSITTLDAIVKDTDGNIYIYAGSDNTVTGRDIEWAAKSPNWVKINGLNGADGITGTAGLPGTAGSITTLDAIVKDTDGNIYAYIGTATTVAGRDAEWEAKSPNWVKITGLNGADGIAGAAGLPGTPGSITTLDAIVKDTDGNIYAYIGTATTVAGRDAEWEAKSPNWVKITGLNGADGIAGAAGLPGTAGSITTLDAIVKDTDGNIYAYVGTATTVAGRDAEWEAKSPNWVKITGQNGSDGIAGAVGLPGTPGSITTLDAIVKDADGNIYIYAGSDNTIAGRDIEWAAKSPNWVKINGLNGADGITGTAGLPGTPGSITTLDAIVKDANGNIYVYVGSDTTVAGRDAEWEAKSPNWVDITGDKGKGDLTAELNSIISIVKADGITPGGEEILFADAVIKVNGGDRGQVLTTKDATGTVGWSNPVNNKLSIKRVEGNMSVDVENDNVIIVDASKMLNGTLTVGLPTVTDENLIGKVFFIKRVDGNDNVIVTVASQGGGTIDDDGSTVTVGQNITFQIILESLLPTVKWQTLSKF